MVSSLDLILMMYQQILIFKKNKHESFSCKFKNKLDVLSVVDSNPDSLKTKKSELRLYCDLLMQQVHMIKTAVSNDKEPDLQVSRSRNYFYRWRDLVEIVLTQ